MGSKLKFNGDFPVTEKKTKKQNHQKQQKPRKSKIQIAWDYRNWRKINTGKLNAFK